VVAAKEALVKGTGSLGGRFELGADGDGHVLVTTLVRGRWCVYASEATHGLARRAIEIPLASDEPVLILLPR